MTAPTLTDFLRGDALREHRVESVSDGYGGYQWKCSCGTSGPVVRSFSETDAGALTHAAGAGR